MFYKRIWAVLLLYLLAFPLLADELPMLGYFIDYFVTNDGELGVCRGYSSEHKFEYFALLNNKFISLMTSEKPGVQFSNNNKIFTSCIKSNQDDIAIFLKKYSNVESLKLYQTIIQAVEISPNKYILAALDKKDYGKGYICLFDGKNIREANLETIKPILIGDFLPFYYDRENGNIYFAANRWSVKNGLWKQLDQGIFVYNFTSTEKKAFRIAEKGYQLVYPYGIPNTNKIIIVRNGVGHGSLNEQFYIIDKL